jgi:hypothetical protein
MSLRTRSAESCTKSSWIHRGGIDEAFFYLYTLLFVSLLLAIYLRGFLSSQNVFLSGLAVILFLYILTTYA